MPPLPRPPARSPLQTLIREWDGCLRCEYGPRAKKHVHFRGVLPCDLLFVGEGPGASENLLGVPFRGPAGKLLDDMYARALAASGLDSSPRTAWVNVVACIPLEATGSKAADSRLKPECAKACRPRLEGMITLARPRLIVTLGLDAKEYLPKMLPAVREARVWNLPHPAALIRLSVANQAMEIQKAEVRLRDALVFVFAPPEPS